MFTTYLQDLFPGLEVPSNDYGEFSVALDEQLDKHGLQKVWPTGYVSDVQFVSFAFIMAG